MNTCFKYSEIEIVHDCTTDEIIRLEPKRTLYNRYGLDEKGTRKKYSDELIKAMRDHNEILGGRILRTLLKETIYK